MEKLGFSPGPVRRAGDGFAAWEKSLAALLAEHGIHTYRNEQGQPRRCADYFDDWHLYRIPEGTWGLFKIREQEFDGADGDTPGVTVSFVEFSLPVLEAAMQDSREENRTALAREINRVVSWKGQRHSGALRDYFCCPEAEGAYLIASLYTDKLAALAENGGVALPEKPLSRRLEGFIRESGLCRKGKIRVSSPVTRQERRVLLAAFTGCCSLHSFAAEVRFHAKFLVPWLPGVYASALRADMTPLSREFLPAMPYYRAESVWVKAQKKTLPRYDEA